MVSMCEWWWGEGRRESIHHKNKSSIRCVPQQAQSQSQSQYESFTGGNKTGRRIYLGSAVVEDISRLDVSMHDSSSMDVIQALSYQGDGIDQEDGFIEKKKSSLNRMGSMGVCKSHKDHIYTCNNLYMYHCISNLVNGDIRCDNQ